jgi:tetratricopeptide (TPR) repeat protein
MPAAQPPDSLDAEALARVVAKEPRNSAAWHMLGLALLDDGKIDRAITAFRRALRVDEALAEAHNDLGTAYFQKGWHAEAEGCFRKATELKPDHAIAHANLGAALRAQARLSESRRAYQRALTLRIRGLLPKFLRWPLKPPAAPAPADKSFHGELAAIADALGSKDIAKALRLARAAEKKYPQEADVLQVAALAFEEAKDIAPALERSRAAIARKPDRAEYHITAARLLVKSGDQAAALDAAMQALKLEPGSAEVHATIAGIYHPWREDLAEQAARRAIELDPASHAGQGNLAAALWGLGRLDEAERHAREAVRLKPGQISYRANLALICKDQGRLDQARELYRGLIAEAPDHPTLALDLGTLAAECEGDLDAARTWYRKAQQLSGEPRAFLSEALIDLLDGRFESAWERYEARKQVADQRPQHAMFASIAPWSGAAPPERRLLVYAEQGLGDEIMFASMYGELGRRVPRVALLCDPRAGALFRRSFPAFEVIGEPRSSQGERAKHLPAIECAVAAGSLGRLFRRRREDFPEHRGYLVPDPEKVAAWQERLAALGPGAKIGLSWIGGMQKTGRSRRSLSLAELRPLLDAPGTSWVSLQYTPCAPEIAALAAAGGPRIAEFAGVTADMDELASLIAALDLVVSVCNTTVHVAGALGKDVLVMAPLVPEWRYGMRGERMVWYPSARVFRQARYGVWDQVLEDVKARLPR